MSASPALRSTTRCWSPCRTASSGCAIWKAPEPPGQPGVGESVRRRDRKEAFVLLALRRECRLDGIERLAEGRQKPLPERGQSRPSALARRTGERRAAPPALSPRSAVGGRVAGRRRPGRSGRGAPPSGCGKAWPSPSPRRRWRPWRRRRRSARDGSSVSSWCVSWRSSRGQGKCDSAPTARRSRAADATAAVAVEPAV